MAWGLILHSGDHGKTCVGFHMKPGECLDLLVKHPTKLMVWGQTYGVGMHDNQWGWKTSYRWYSDIYLWDSECWEIHWCYREMHGAISWTAVSCQLFHTTVHTVDVLLWVLYFYFRNFGFIDIGSWESVFQELKCQKTFGFPYWIMEGSERLSVMFNPKNIVNWVSLFFAY